MKFKRTDHGEQTTLAIDGVLDTETSSALRPVIEGIVADHRRDVVLDLSGLDTVDSSGVAAIISLYRPIHGAGGTVRIEGIRDQPLAIFKLLRYDKVFGL
ncbi:MAG TPA: STAS domain-containing protein [Kofleriaceae bacterium]|nr:STAS domain-containing protein [Kofleriaceae bacterium]